MGRDKAKPKRPIRTIFFLPMESLSLPHIGLNNIQAIADDAKINPICNSDKPRSLAAGGTVINTNDWPAPTDIKPAERNQIDLGRTSEGLFIN